MRRVAGAALVVLLATGCTTGPTPTPTATLPAPTGDGVLRIGTLFSTGDAAAAGLTAAVNAAVREIDAAGGVNGAPVEVISRNGGTAGDGTAEDSFADLVARGVDVVIGPSTVEVAAVLQPLAAEAGVPLVSPVASGARPEGSTMFRTVPSLQAQAAAIAAQVEGSRIAVLHTGDVFGEALAAAVDDPAADIVLGADPAIVTQQLTAADADAVLLAAADAGPETAALLLALADAGYAGPRLWITGAALTRYDLPPGSLEGAHGIRSGATTDPAFAAQVRQEDPGARTLAFARNAFDATVLVALAAELADDDGGPSVGATLPLAAAGGILCHSFGECLDTLRTQPDVAYQGLSGALEFNGAGDRVGALYTRFVYDATGVPGVVDEVAG